MANQLYGTCATEEDVSFLKSRLPPNLTPDWLVSLLKDYRLGGVCFSLGAEHDKSGLAAHLFWFTPRQVVSESFDVEPGISILSSGFLPVGGCLEGSGDPYFLDLREVSPDPPLVRVPHDYGGREVYPLNRIELVTSSVSEFLENARVQNSRDCRMGQA